MILTTANVHLEIYPTNEGAMASFSKEITLQPEQLTCEVGPLAAGNSRELAVSIPVTGLKVTSSHFKPWEKEKIEKMVHDRLLNATDHPEIKFKGKATLLPRTPLQMKIAGTVSLKGRSRNVSVELTDHGKGEWRGTFQVCQSDFGIVPASSFGGALRSRDEVGFSLCIIHEDFFNVSTSSGIESSLRELPPTLDP